MKQRIISSRMQGFLISLLIIVLIFVICYCICLGLGSLELFQAYFWNTLGRALFFSGLRLKMGPSVVFFLLLFWPLFYIDLELINNMNPASREDSSSSGAEKGKRPVEISQDHLWETVDQIQEEKGILCDSDWTASWVTERENELGDLINKLRKEEHMRPLGPYRLQFVIETLETKYSISDLEKIINDIKINQLNSSFYQESKMDREIPKEAELKAAWNDVRKNP